MSNYYKFKEKIHQIKNTIPQIIAYSGVSEKGTIFLKKKVMNYLNLKENIPVTISAVNEIILSTKEGGVKLSILPGNKIKLPIYILAKLQIRGKSRVCFIKRAKSVAIKKFEINVVNAEFPRIIDFETTYVVTRQLETFGDPLEIYEKQKEKKDKYKLKYNPCNFWHGKKSLNSWKARKILGSEEGTDNDLQIDLIQKRLQTQNENGSWKNDIILTAKNLLELKELGLNSNHPQVQKAISWIIERPESPFNPGMFFLNDDLVKEQIEIIERRKEHISGPRERFRNRRTPELRQIASFDKLYFNPCGQRIIWANAIVMEALLAYGYEYHNRIQNTLDTLTFSRWCECAYQHGKSDWDRSFSMSLKEIHDFYNQALFEFKHGGLNNLDLLRRIPSQNHLLRIDELSKKTYTEYYLRLPMPQQGCEFITTGALHQVRDEKISRLVEAHLWRFAVLLYNSIRQPEMALELVKYNITYYFQLQVVAKFNSLPAKLGIHFVLPWIIQNQNSDGSWGIEKYRESATLAIINALKRIDFL